MNPITLTPGALTLDVLRALWAAPRAVAVDPSARAAVDAAAATIVARDRPADTSSTASTPDSGCSRGRGSTRRGSPNCSARWCFRMPPAPVRCSTTPSCGSSIALKIASLARGYSGVRWEVIEALVRCRTPASSRAFPRQGSVGASGDLAPLAHLAAVLIGEGESAHRRARICRWRRRAGRRGPAAARRSRRRRASRCSTARRSRPRWRSPGCSPPSARSRRRSSPARCRSTRASAATRRSTRASTAVRGHARPDGRRGASIATLLAGSAIRASHVDCHRVQDPYSLRCQPQVMGACLDQMRSARRRRSSIEANAVSDNPLVFAADDDGAVRRQFPRRAGRLRRRQPRARDRRDRRDVGAAHRAADGHEPVGPAAVPGRGRRRQLRLHDRAGDRGGARVREQGARASRIRSIRCRPPPTRRTTSAWRPARRGG